MSARLTRNVAWPYTCLSRMTYVSQELASYSGAFEAPPSRLTPEPAPAPAPSSEDQLPPSAPSSDSADSPSVFPTTIVDDDADRDQASADADAVDGVDPAGPGLLATPGPLPPLRSLLRRLVEGSGLVEKESAAK